MSEQQHSQKLGNQMINVDNIKVVDRIIAPTQARVGLLATGLSGSLRRIVPIIATKYLNTSCKVITPMANNTAVNA